VADLKLKQSLARSVEIEPGSGGRRVVKRFASPSPVRRLRDRSRAEREFAILKALAARGVRVPIAEELRRTAQGFEVVMQRVEGAVALDAWLEGRAPRTVAPERLARSLGELLAQLHACGLDHPDLHAGNVLIDADGEPWAIDFHAARMSPALSASTLRRDLERACAGVRELVSPRFRARFLVAWWRALSPSMRELLPSRSVLAREVEHRAREVRREVVRKRRARWTRAGSAVRAVRAEDGLRYEAVELSPQRAAELCARLAAAPRRADAEGILDIAPDGTLAIHGLHRSQLREAWYATARLAEHRVTAARPLVLASGPRAGALFQIPPGSRPLFEDPARDRRRGARAFGACIGALHDRGLAIARPRPQHFWRAPSGEVFPAGALSLFELSDEARHTDLQRILAAASLAAPFTRIERAAFACGYIAAQRCDARELARLRTELASG
jgi:tRNA A-37 threonylcarbamoyl transferase component Bud32